MSFKYKVTTTTKVIDKGANNLFKQLEMLDGVVISSGIHEEEGSVVPTLNGKKYSDTPVAQYAFFNEYGTARIPARPFMQITVRDRQEQFARDSMTDMRKLARGSSTSELLQKNTEKLSNWFKATIWNLREPPNAASTLRIKKLAGAGSNPLLFTRTMRDSIKSIVHPSKIQSVGKLRRIINNINEKHKKVKI